MQSLLRIVEVIQKLTNVRNCDWLILKICVPVLQLSIAPGKYLPNQELHFQAGGSKGRPWGLSG